MIKGSTSYARAVYDNISTLKSQLAWEYVSILKCFFHHRDPTTLPRVGSHFVHVCGYTVPTVADEAPDSKHIRMLMAHNIQPFPHFIANQFDPNGYKKKVSVIISDGQDRNLSRAQRATALGNKYLGASCYKAKFLLSKMEVSNVNNGGMINSMERLVGNNYKYWKMCMEAYLQGQDLCELVAGSDAIIPVETLDKEFIEHVRDLNSPKEVWDTLEKLFSKKNTARLQFLENELANSRQEEIDTNEKISESRLRRYLIRGLKKEYVPFITSIQGWATQPSVEELENLLSNQEALAKQMAKGFENDACGKVGHIKRYCRSKVTKANVACSSNDDDEVKWEQCFTVDMVVKKNQWIVDSGCSHHVTGDGTLLHDVRDHNQNRVVTRLTTQHIRLKRKIFSHKLVDGIPQLKNVCEEVICQGCQYGKSHRLPYKKSTNRKQGLLDLIHTDLMGPTKTPSYSVHCYVMVLIDDYSRFTWVKFLKEKSEAISKFIEFKEAVESKFGRKVKALRSDNGGEFMLPRELWAEALQCACHVSNRLPSWPGTQKSAFELAYGQKPNERLEVYVSRNKEVYHFKRCGGLTEEPTCYEEAKDSSDWRKAIQEEIDALKKNETWELVKKPEVCKLVTCKWVYRLKKNSDGTINRFKARLVAGGWWLVAFVKVMGLIMRELLAPWLKW
ncbi:uncharacterized protein [Rutidosis leptorrhynchoides]|uniref:uncharacterized protein n=1 Tax=Rutidosis leptorrhynchoides TaxID=125765 RepID=UPI003A9A2F44